MKLFGVAGRPILHSLSPEIHRALYARFGVDAAYLRVRADGPEDILTLMREAGFKGMNATSPFKESLFPLLDRLDDSAVSTGAVNTILAGTGGLRGFNTDTRGIAEALKKSGIPLRRERVLVLGAGGAGRAAVRAMQAENAFVTVINRGKEKTELLAESMGCASLPWEELPAALSGHRLLINTIPASPAFFPIDRLRPGTTILDADYRNAPLEAAARDRGCRYIPGTEWLLRQGVAAFLLMNGLRPEEAPLPEEDFLPGLSARVPEKKKGIVLVGFMGSGKTTIGRRLAESLSYAFLDTDEWIEEREQMTVSEIFARRGEARFRALEREAVGRFTGVESLVLSCGGGAVCDPASRAEMKRHGWVVWLYTPLARTAERIKNGSRPLWQDRREDLLRLFTERKTAYALTADLVAFNIKHVQETADDIRSEIDPFLAP